MHIAKVSASAFILAAATSPSWSKDMTFDIIYANHANIVVADGEITAQTPDAFQAFLDTEPFDGFSFFIDLNSPGGNLMGGMELGRMIRKEGLTTRVASYQPRDTSAEYWSPIEEPGICMSACALAFLGGEDRELKTSSALGFHQFSSAGNAAGEVADVYETETSTQVISALVHNYIETMGVSATLFSKMSLALPEEMYVPTRQELTSLSIIPREAFSDFVLEPYRDGVVAHASFPENVEGRNIVSQLTAYCRGGTPFLLLSKPEDFRPLDQTWLDLANQMLNGFSLWKPPGETQVDYPASSVRLSIEGRAVAEIQIDQRGIDLLLEEAKGVVQLPGALGTSMRFLIQPTEADKRILKGAFSLCIDGQSGGEPSSKSDIAPQDPTELLVEHYNRYLSNWSLSNPAAMSSMTESYGDEIDFYGKIIPKSDLLDEKLKFAERWPERAYTSRQGSFEVSCSDKICKVAALIDWYAHSPERGKTARGVAWYELGFDVDTGRIVYENGESRKL